jgi:hypothetical protein
VIVAVLVAAGFVLVTAGVTVLAGSGAGLVSAGVCLLGGAWLTERALAVAREGDA